ncbi:uncharacterized protein [Amphiura filiformis]|uniref:uncharacterized protein n=1 Tax=Amphiura filiformis TaxID=82378 RepID=UPI003B218B9F
MGSPVSAIVANLFMEWLEKEAVATAPLDCKPKIWRRYVDDVLEIIQKDSTQKLTDHLNLVDPTRNIKFTFEEEDQGKIPFLDTLIVHKEDGSMKLLVYRKKTHTDQYLDKLPKARQKQKDDAPSKGMVVIPYVEGLAERLQRIFRKHNVTTAMRPTNTLKSLLVHLRTRRT